MRKKVQWKKEHLTTIRNMYTKGDKYNLTVLIDHMWYAKAFDVPYFEVDTENTRNNSWVIMYPKDLNARRWLIQKNHVEPYSEFPELDDIFDKEW